MHEEMKNTQPEMTDITEHQALRLRNMFVTVAAVLFVHALVFPQDHVSHAMRAVACFFGACAYGVEVAVLTDSLKKKVSLNETPMPYVFGLLYVFMGIGYLSH